MFSGSMVRAILDDRKTQTRRVVKSFKHMVPARGVEMDCVKDADGAPSRVDMAPDNWEMCPYGKPGDRLWVRETCRASEDNQGVDGVLYVADNNVRVIENTKDAADAWVKLNWYHGYRAATVPPIHMPRWASRITLEVTEVRVQRLQEISNPDAIAEGVDRGTTTADFAPHHVFAFQRLWDSINAKRAPWASNPWVWAVTFRRI